MVHYLKSFRKQLISNTVQFNLPIEIKLIFSFQSGYLSVFFNDYQFTITKRSELYGATDFFAYCGGVLGLCLGVSLLSVVEIIYYFTLRLYCNLHRRKVK